VIGWFVQTLKTYPEIAIFLSLAIGYFAGSFTFKGIGLGAVTATLIAAVIIGQIGITVTGPLKPFAFLMFLFAIGYGVGPQFVRGIAQDGIPQAMFAVLQCVFSLLVCVAVAKFLDYDLGAAVGFYAGSQTLSASMGLGTDAINRLGLAADQVKPMLDIMPVAYAITYIFGTVGSAIIIAVIGPPLLGINLVEACKRYMQERGGQKSATGSGTAWHQFDLRAYRVKQDGPVVGMTPIQAEALIPNQRVFIERIRREGRIIEAGLDTVIQAGDIVAVAGRRAVLVGVVGATAEEVEDRDLLSVPAEGVDVYVTSKDVDSKTLAEISAMPLARGIFLRKITRGAISTEIPILPDTKLNRGDIVTLVGSTKDIANATKAIGVVDRVTDVADVAFIGGAITIGALAGAFVYKVGGIPLTLSTAGGALFAGLFFGWLRSVRPTFGRIPSPTVWFMNSVGLNIFIAIIGIASGPAFVAGLQKLGFSLFMWGMVATAVPLILGMFAGKYIFKFHDALLLGIVSGSRTTTASLGMVCDQAKSQIPALGYTVTYAVGNTLLTIWGMVLVMLLS
jgi:putative transport protein